MTNAATTRYFAAYDADTIYGVGTTELLALDCAAQWTYGDGAREGDVDDLATAEISKALFDKISENGWDGRNQSFEIRDGELFETTGE